MIQIISYDAINGLPFGSTEANAIAKFGPPTRRSKNRERELELHYPDFVLRFDADSGGLRECSLFPQCSGMINGAPVQWTEDFLRWLASEDQDLLEVLGFILSMKLGIAVSGFHDGDESQKAIHAFRKGDWDMFRNRMQSFKVPRPPSP